MSNKNISYKHILLPSTYTHFYYTKLQRSLYEVMSLYVIGSGTGRSPLRIVYLGIYSWHPAYLNGRNSLYATDIWCPRCCYCKLRLFVGWFFVSYLISKTSFSLSTLHSRKKTWQWPGQVELEQKTSCNVFVFTMYL